MSYILQALLHIHRFARKSPLDTCTFGSIQEYNAPMVSYRACQNAYTVTWVNNEICCLVMLYLFNRIYVGFCEFWFSFTRSLGKLMFTLELVEARKYNGNKYE